MEHTNTGYYGKRNVFLYALELVEQTIIRPIQTQTYTPK